MKAAMGRATLVTALGMLVAALVTAAAQATIASTTGAVTKIAPPPSVLFGAMESDTTMFAFDEQQNIVLQNDLAVDITDPGTYNDTNLPPGGVIPKGTVVSSQFVLGDKVGTGNPTVHFDATIVTDGLILGIAVRRAALDGSDFLGAPGTVYPTGDPGRQLNFQEKDFVIEQIDRHTVVIHSNVKPRSDQIRIITAGQASPTPRSLKQDVLDEINGTIPTSDKHDTDKLREAAKNLGESLESGLWGDDNHLALKGGDKVFEKEKEAVKKLSELLKDKSPTVSTGTLQGWIDSLVAADKNLAQTAIDEAGSGDPKKLDEANKEMGKADDELTKGHEDGAIDHYKNAWKKAMEALKK
jgi:hypothetical protein